MIRYALSALMIAGAGLVACSPSESASDTKIYGGTPVAAGAYPAVVGLAFGNAGDEAYAAECTGTLIAPSVVLTAGHCIDTKQDVVVYTGEGQDDAKIPVATAHRVAERLPFPALRRYPLGYGDYALLKLVEPLQGIEPLPLVQTLVDRVAVERAGQVTLVGYGRREDGRAGRKFEASVSLQHATGPEAVVGGAGRDACAGDSGGPALAANPDGKQAVYGVVSRGLGLDCGKGGYVGLTSDVATWIAENAGLAPPQPEDPKRAIMLALGVKSWKAAEIALAQTTSLALDGLMLTDVRPLARLTRLESLSLQSNRIVDLTPLKNLKKLKSLRIAGNDIVDADALAALESRGLLIYGKPLQRQNYFRTEFLRQCQDPETSDAARQTIKAVFYVTMADDCAKANERLLLLSTLRLGNRPLTDVSPLAGLETLKSLDLTHTAVTDLSPLAPLILRGLVVTGATP